MAKSATITTVAMAVARPSVSAAKRVMLDVVFAISASPAEKTLWFDEKHDRHDDKDHGVGSLGVEHFGQPFDDTQAKAGDDRPQDRSHAADDHHREDHDDEIRAHLRVHGV